MIIYLVSNNNVSFRTLIAYDIIISNVIPTIFGLIHHTVLNDNALISHIDSKCQGYGVTIAISEVIPIPGTQLALHALDDFSRCYARSLCRTIGAGAGGAILDVTYQVCVIIGYSIASGNGYSMLAATHQTRFLAIDRGCRAAVRDLAIVYVTHYSARPAVGTGVAIVLTGTHCAQYLTILYRAIGIIARPAHHTACTASGCNRGAVHHDLAHIAGATIYPAHCATDIFSVGTDVRSGDLHIRDMRIDDQSKETAIVVFGLCSFQTADGMALTIEASHKRMDLRVVGTGTPDGFPVDIAIADVDVGSQTDGAPLVGVTNFHTVGYLAQLIGCCDDDVAGGLILLHGVHMCPVGESTDRHLIRHLLCGHSFVCLSIRPIIAHSVKVALRLVPVIAICHISNVVVYIIFANDGSLDGFSGSTDSSIHPVLTYCERIVTFSPCTYHSSHQTTDMIPSFNLYRRVLHIVFLDGQVGLNEADKTACMVFIGSDGAIDDAVSGNLCFVYFQSVDTSCNAARSFVESANGAIDDGTVINITGSIAYDTSGILDVACHTAVHHTAIADDAIGTVRADVSRATDDAACFPVCINFNITYVDDVIVHYEILDTRIFNLRKETVIMTKHKIRRFRKSLAVAYDVVLSFEANHVITCSIGVSTVSGYLKLITTQVDIAVQADVPSTKSATAI